MVSNLSTGKATANHNSLHILFLLFHMFRHMYRAIIRQEDTKEKLLCKIKYLIYFTIFIYARVGTFICM